jgi:hypothetical protein
MGRDILFVGAAMIILGAAFLKVIGIINATRWMANNGPRFIEDMQFHEKNGTLSVSVIEDAYQDRRGNFFPFGAKDYLFERWIRKLTLSNNKLHYVLRTYRRYLGRRRRLIRIISASLVIVAVMPGSINGLESAVCLAGILVSFAMNQSVIVEFMVGSIMMVDYVKYYHMLGDGDISVFHGLERTIGYSRAAIYSGVNFLLELLLSIIVASSAATFLLFKKFHAFNVYLSNDFDVHPVLENIKIMIRSIYFVTTTLSTTGYGDIVPQEEYCLGYVLVIALHIQAMLLITFAVSVFWSSRTDDDDLTSRRRTKRD